ncbi:MAG: PilZ domain-containing protein [Candidatus Omnitrophica bacterium]|nr:PilZ domain-containing protein [Candidatus Omnitrophota bacterium]
MLHMKERRRFIRHPICYPLEFEHASKKIRERTNTLNVSEGGLLFLSRHHLKKNEIIILKMPLQDKVFKVRAKVMHTAKDSENTNLFNIGVSFYRYSDAFKVKLVEQLYLIDEYRMLRSLQLGHELSMQKASEEWIKRYSKRFARLYW